MGYNDDYDVDYYSYGDELDYGDELYYGEEGDDEYYDYYDEVAGRADGFRDDYDDEYDDEDEFEPLHPSHQSSFFKPDSPISRFISERNDAFEMEHRRQQGQRSFKNPYYKLLGWVEPAESPQISNIRYLPVQ